MRILNGLFAKLAATLAAAAFAEENETATARQILCAAEGARDRR